MKIVEFLVYTKDLSVLHVERRSYRFDLDDSPTFFEDIFRDADILGAAYDAECYAHIVG